MIALEEAQRRTLALGQPLPIEPTPLTAALGRWAALDHLARRTQPARDIDRGEEQAVKRVGQEIARAGSQGGAQVTPGQVARHGNRITSVEQ